jgi:hypothetical protein
MIFFFLPENDIPPFSLLPDAHDIASYPNLFLAPSLNWTWRTYYHLASTGYPCQLVSSLPDKGIIFSAACNLPILFRPQPEQFIISCVADSPPRFFAQCQIFQSLSQSLLWQESSQLPYIGYMPHWTQPGLLCRDPERGNSLLNLGYFGASNQIDPSLRTQETYLKFKEIGISLNFNFQTFHDYREIDGILAVRSFGRDIISHKPASKLINAWRAGTPAILGKELAFKELYHSDLDYIEVASISEIFDACKRLQDDPNQFEKMSENGLKRAEDFSDKVLTKKWINLLEEEIPILYEKWLKMSPLSRNVYYYNQFILRTKLSAKKRLKQVTKS